MDFEKAADNYIAAWGPETIRLKKDLADAFRRINDRAHRQGQEEMRKRASGAVPTSWLDSLLTGKGTPKIPYQGPDVEKLLDSLSNRIRNLPIVIDEQKSSPEFLPKASTKEVWIK